MIKSNQFKKIIFDEEVVYIKKTLSKKEIKYDEIEKVVINIPKYSLSNEEHHLYYYNFEFLRQNKKNENVHEMLKKNDERINEVIDLLKSKNIEVQLVEYNNRLSGVE